MNTLKTNKKILLLLTFIILSSNCLAADNLKKVAITIKFPTLNVLNNEGKLHTLKFNKSLKKYGYVINFWATWCVPCKKELPDLQLLKSKLKNYEIDVLTISIDKKNIEDQLIFLSKNGASDLTHFFDKKMEVFKALKLRGIPTTIFVDQNGRIISKYEGILKWGEDKITKEVIDLFN